MCGFSRGRGKNENNEKSLVRAWIFSSDVWFHQSYPATIPGKYVPTLQCSLTLFNNHESSTSHPRFSSANYLDDALAVKSNSPSLDKQTVGYCCSFTLTSQYCLLAINKHQWSEFLETVEYILKKWMGRREIKTEWRAILLMPWSPVACVLTPSDHDRAAEQLICRW